RRPSLDAPWRARRPGAGDGELRRGAPRAPRGTGPPFRRALHDRPRRADPVERPRGRARCRAPSVQLPRVVERRPGVMPPKPGPPPRQVSRRRIVKRRLAALAGALVAALLILGLVKVADRTSGSPPPPATTIVAAPKPFRVVFPEGF